MKILVSLTLSCLLALPCHGEVLDGNDPFALSEFENAPNPKRLPMNWLRGIHNFKNDMRHHAVESEPYTGPATPPDLPQVEESVAGFLL